MPRPPWLRLFALGLGLVATIVAGGTVHGKSIFGWTERVKLVDADMTLEAKLDTGAETSSLHAPDPEPFEKDGEDWVRFEVADDDGNEHTFERPVERTIRIRSASGVTERYVVELALCVGTVERTKEINLADREELSTRMLVGRNFMAGEILVDPGDEFTRDPACDDGDDREEDDDSEDDDDAEDDGDEDDDG
ncbi:ATP-dependent zinc protease [Aquisalimonas lutea]|uniref:ATP-dependent zinc protease family protein n=1 Tax=Aquisalimonas lutea TaxID=1327750 RepID=UPI0025B5CD16|nr:ATP-dependent zinc protease [Aquisalimonas lutea]MDN3516179.1 ATP-dependent zinc protease [Aquisalimonas lutea]